MVTIKYKSDAEWEIIEEGMIKDFKFISVEDPHNYSGDMYHAVMLDVLEDILKIVQGEQYSFTFTELSHILANCTARDENYEVYRHKNKNAVFMYNGWVKECYVVVEGDDGEAEDELVGLIKTFGGAWLDDISERDEQLYRKLYKEEDKD